MLQYLATCIIYLVTVSREAVKEGAIPRTEKFLRTVTVTKNALPLATVVMITTSGKCNIKAEETTGKW